MAGGGWACLPAGRLLRRGEKDFKETTLN